MAVYLQAVCSSALIVETAVCVEMGSNAIDAASGAVIDAASGAEIDAASGAAHLHANVVHS